MAVDILTNRWGHAGGAGVGLNTILSCSPFVIAILSFAVEALLRCLIFYFKQSFSKGLHYFLSLGRGKEEVVAMIRGGGCWESSSLGRKGHRVCPEVAL